MNKAVHIIGAGLAGSEAALQLAWRGIPVVLHEMRPLKRTDVHETGSCAELVCSNSLKSMKPDSAAGMLKNEMEMLGSALYGAAKRHAVPAGGALAVDRHAFAEDVSQQVESNENIQLERGEVSSVAELAQDASAVVLATGPLTSDALADDIVQLTGADHLAFFDAAAPIVEAESLDMGKLFRQSRYEGAEAVGDYLNAPFDKEEYETFIDELLAANRVIARDFESKDLFSACQPIEEIARAGRDAPRFGPLKPVGLTDPRTGRRPWAALQLRAENADCTSYNLVGFQTNLTFPEQKRVFGMIPGLENAVFSRYGVMHRNTFIDAPHLLDETLRFAPDVEAAVGVPLYVAGQLSGTEGYCEAIRSGLHVALAIAADTIGVSLPPLPRATVFGALLAYATDPSTENYQPMHVNFGIIEPLEVPIKNKGKRYAAYAERGREALEEYVDQLEALGLMQVGQS